MATEKEITELADKIIQHGQTFVKNAKSAFDAVPYVERTVQLSQELQVTFKSCPTGFPQERLAGTTCVGQNALTHTSVLGRASNRKAQYRKQFLAQPSWHPPAHKSQAFWQKTPSTGMWPSAHM